jgi:hypothetical protein
MAGIKGRSGRKPQGFLMRQVMQCNEISDKVNAKLLHWINNLPHDISDRQAASLIQLHIKHSPDPPKPEQKNEALELLKQMAIEGAKEYARIKLMKPSRLHEQVLNDIRADEAEQAELVKHADPVKTDETTHDIQSNDKTSHDVSI